MNFAQAVFHAWRDSRFADRRWHRFRLLLNYYLTPKRKL